MFFRKLARSGPARKRAIAMAAFVMINFSSLTGVLRSGWRNRARTNEWKVWFRRTGVPKRERSPWGRPQKKRRPRRSSSTPGAPSIVY